MVVRDADYLDLEYSSVFLFPQGHRTYSVDMACISISIAWWRQRGAKRFRCLGRGYLEDSFLKSLNVTLDEIQALGRNATQVSTCTFLPLFYEHEFIISYTCVAYQNH